MTCTEQQKAEDGIGHSADTVLTVMPHSHVLRYCAQSYCHGRGIEFSAPLHAVHVLNAQATSLHSREV